MGQDSGSASSSTVASISGIAGNKAARTGDAETGIQKIFDAAKVKDEVNAQVQITQTFNQVAPKAAASYAGSQISTLQKQAELEQDPEKKLALQEEAKKWAPNGDYNIAMNIIIGVAGGGTTGAVSSITKESLSWAADQMRQAMIEDSKKFPGICDTQGNCLDNKSGKSVGVNGDGFKLAGGRVNLEKLCEEERCFPGASPGTWRTKPDGTIEMKAVDAKGNPVNLPALLEANPDWRSPLGGFQGQQGKFMGLGDYQPDGILDKIAEAYSGAHDKSNSKTWYGPDGNIKPGMTKEEQDIGERQNEFNVLLTTPFALSVLLPPDVWNAISVGIKYVKP